MKFFSELALFFYKPFVIMVLWNLFVPMYVKGAPKLSYAVAIGLMLVVASIKFTHTKVTEADIKKLEEKKALTVEEIRLLTVRNVLAILALTTLLGTGLLVGWITLIL